jgi:hypothetical protein
MPNKVLLKNFDVMFKQAQTGLEKTGSRSLMEDAKPRVWTRDQVDDLDNIIGTLTLLANFVSELVARVRND